MPEEPPLLPREPENVDSRRVVRVALGLVAATLLALGLSWLLIARDGRGLDAVRGEPAPARVSSAPEPTWQFRSTGAAAERRRAASERLHSYGWVDRQGGIVHVPIERGIELELGKADTRLGAVLPGDTPFTSEARRAVRLGDLLGRDRPALVTLSYSHCALMCSSVLRGVADLVRQLDAPRPGADYALVNVSIDPNETPDEAARVQAPLLERAGLAGHAERWPFLVGTKDAIDAVARPLGFDYAWDERTRQYAHPAVLYVLGADGRLKRAFSGARFDAREVRSALFGTATEPRGRVAGIQCFRFDAVSRRFGGALVWTYRALGALLVALVVCAWLWLRHAERRRVP